MNRKANLIIISGPSGVGKTTICNKILAQRSDTVYSVSATSRPRRRAEKNGREYFFLSKLEFKKWIREKRFIEYAVVHGNYYGTPRKFIENNLNQGKNVLLDIDVQGAKKIMKLYPDGVFIFVEPPDFVELKNRLMKRNTDTDTDIKNRLSNARKELKYRKAYQYVVVNKDLKTTVKKILQIIDRELNRTNA